MLLYFLYILVANKVFVDGQALRSRFPQQLSEANRLLCQVFQRCQKDLKCQKILNIQKFEFSSTVSETWTIPTIALVSLTFLLSTPFQGEELFSSKY